MRFTRIEAVAFGCHCDCSLELAEGLNIIHGANEAGKSTWLAALYAALCGIRKAKGQPKKEDSEFKRRFTPWPPVTEWKVRATVVLDDGRSFELERDLDGGAEHVRDTVTGVSVAHDLIFDGAADGARWLGLERPAFRAVAFVDQASILSILEEAKSLQDELQRAAQSARVGDTVALAMARLEEFRSSAVGKDWKGAVKPLKLAIDAVAACEQRLAEETELRLQWEKLLQSVTQKQTDAAEARRRLERAGAALAWHEAARLEEKANRVRVLHERHPTAPPSTVAQADRLRAIEEALVLWDQRPAPVELTGSSAADIRKQIDELPPMPAGDLEPHASVTAAYEDFTRARLALEAVGPGPEVASSPHDNLSPRELEDLALDLETRVPPAPAVAESGSGSGAERPPPPRARRSLWRAVAATGGVATAAGMVLVGMQRYLAGAIAAVAGVAAVWLGVRRSSGVHAREALRLGDIAQERRRALEQVRAEELANRLQSTRERCAALGLPADPGALRSIAANIARHADLARQHEAWKKQHDTRSAALKQAMPKLADALAARDARSTGDPESSWRAYAHACLERRHVATQAEKRQSLERMLSVRETAERQATEAERRRTAADEGVRAVAAASLGATVSDAKQAVPVLRDLRGKIKRGLAQHGQAVHEWEELRALLDGEPLDQLLGRAAHAHHNANSLVRATGIDPATEPEPTREALERLQGGTTTACEVAASLGGQLTALGGRLQPLGELEEDLADARTELDRVRRLEDTIDATLRFLKLTEEQIYRDIAPRLTDDLTSWLPRVTAGRYREARVDPETLAVRVRETATGELRDAAALSYGAREQVYLLLRASLVGYIAPDESCPLLLDEVTAFCDATREVCVLETLLDLSRDRQIVLCTHDDAVVRWARALGPAVTVLASKQA